MGVYHFVSRTKTRDKIATMYNILIIYTVLPRCIAPGYNANPALCQVIKYAK